MQKPIDRVLVPVDDSGPALHAAWIGLAIARSMQASLTLLHVHMQELARRATIRMEADKLPALSDESYGRMLSRMVGDPSVKTLRGEFKDAEIDVVECSHSPSEAITEYAEQQRTDLICMGANIHSPLHDLLMGSVATEVLEHAKCSVTVVH